MKYDVISRQDAIDVVKKYLDGALVASVAGLERRLMTLPSAQPERKKGKWIKKMRITETEKYTSYVPDWYCACCGTKYDPHMARMVNFCYVCGADMRGEQDE